MRFSETVTPIIEKAAKALQMRWRYLCLLPWVVLFVCGCGPSAGERDFQKMIIACTNKYSAIQIKRACLPLIEQYHRQTADGAERLPVEITSLPLFSDAPKEIQVMQADADTPTLMFITGGGFGHWGIIVCSQENDEKLMRRCGKRLTPWTNGVYFYRE